METRGRKVDGQYVRGGGNVMSKWAHHLAHQHRVVVGQLPALGAGGSEAVFQDNNPMGAPGTAKRNLLGNARG